MADSQFNIPSKFTFDSIYTDSWKPDKPGDSISGMIIMTGEKMLKDDYVPFIEIVTEEGESREILLSSAPLKALWLTGEVIEGRMIAVRYDGESTTIQAAGNWMKKWSFSLWTEMGDKIDLRFKLQKMRTFAQRVAGDEDLKRQLSASAETEQSAKESVKISAPTDVDFEEAAKDSEDNGNAAGSTPEASLKKSPKKSKK